MFNNKWMKRIALIMVIVMSVMTLASCQSGRTYEDATGDANGIYVSGKEQNPEVPYTGDPIVNYVKVDDPNQADESYPYGEGPGSGSSNNDDGTGDDNNNGGDNTGNDDSNTGNNDSNTGNDDSNTGNDDSNTGNNGNNGGDDQQNESYDAANLLKVISYNVRCANDGGGNDIIDRAPRLEKVIKDRDPDLMGFQEVNSKWLEPYLVPFFGDKYDYVYQYRDSSANSECTPIFWKKDKFELVESGYFWLSETPNESSKGWGASHYRVCSWVKMKLKSTGKEFIYYNTHFDFSSACHVGSAKLILSHAKTIGGFTKYPVFFTADCNMQRYTEGYEAMMAESLLSDINWDLEDLDYATGGGYHLDGHEGLVKGSPIDYCFYSPASIVPLKYQIIDEKVFGGYASDHKGLYIEMALK